MAAFTRADPSDRAAFDLHHQRIRDDPDCILLAIEDDDDRFVGTIGSFTMHGEREVTYWIDLFSTGPGPGPGALGAFVELEATRPLFARAAEHNIGSATVLTRAGFAHIVSVFLLRRRRTPRGRDAHRPPHGEGHHPGRRDRVASPVAASAPDREASMAGSGREVLNRSRQMGRRHRVPRRYNGGGCLREDAVLVHTAAVVGELVRRVRGLDGRQV